MEQPLISVIVPVYKTENYLEKCVDSILAQTYENLEVLLVDDGSPDNCGAICDAYAEKDSRVRVIHKPNGGLSSARNAALDVCKGDYIGFVDSDDWIEPTLCEAAMDLILSHDLDVVYLAANAIEGDANVGVWFADYPDGTIREASEMMERSLRDEISGQAWRKLCHRRCWEQVRFPEGRIYEDLAVSYMPFLYAKRPVGFLSKPLYNYRLNDAGISRAPSPNKCYHIFLGFKDHYEFAVENLLEESGEICLKKAVIHGLQVFHDAYRYHWKDIDDNLADVRAFIRRERKRILFSGKVPLGVKLRVRLFCASEGTYRRCAKAYLKLRALK